MGKQSAGILMYRRFNDLLEVLLVHPGGPFYINKDLGAWSIPKGEFTDEEKPKDAAIREFKEELGISPEGNMLELTPAIQKGGKKVYAWALEGTLDTQNITCNTFSMEWPPKSGIMKQFPEIDKAEWFPVRTAIAKINRAQIAFIDELILILKDL
jgi:predicted NUDIX family NTP pyrophosphohydrolase